MTELCLRESPFPSGNKLEEISKDRRYCLYCHNLYALSAHVTIELGRAWSFASASKTVADRAAQSGRKNEAPAWTTESNRSDYDAIRFESELVDISNSAADGCQTCSLLMDILTKLNPKKLDFTNPKLRLGVIFCKGSVLQLELHEVEETWETFFNSPRHGKWKLLDQWEIYTFADFPSPWPSIGTFLDRVLPEESHTYWMGGEAKHIANDPASQPALDTIKRWIQECKLNHSLCSHADADIALNGSFPKRVISIASQDVRNIRLIETDDSFSPKNEHFIALSHCWGKTRNLLLTQARLALWKSKIPYDGLSQSFKDAVILTQRLGVKYLWIDSLCIIQDDKKDWEVESAKMASIYEGALVVVAATGSVNGDFGFLNQRRPFITTSGKHPDGTPFQIYGRRTVSHLAFSWGMVEGTDFPAAENVVDYPLLSRAWCFQERVLATRFLHFTQEEMVFDCLTCMTCECGALVNHKDDILTSIRSVVRVTQPGILEQMSKLFKYRTKYRRWGLASKTGGKFMQHHELWRDMVVAYSKKKITRKTDGLPALAGLASKWQNDLTGRYLAGLWEKDLLNGLRWIVDEPTTGDDIGSEYIAPSWSWLSVHGSVSWGGSIFEGNEFFVKIDCSRTECPPSGLNPFGEISCGYIFVTGRIMTLQLFPPRHLEKNDPNSESHTFDADNLYHSAKLGLKEVVCLRLCTNETTLNAYDDDCALVLRKPDQHILSVQPEHVRNFGHVYQRVGYTTKYSAKNWQHDRDSEEVELYLI